MNVSRRLPDNTINPKEPNQQRIFVTSAGSKTSFSYDVLIDLFEKQIIDPQNTFTFGCDYRVPMMHGLLEKSYINDLKMSPSYNEESFAREYLSLWDGANEESWFSYDKLQKYRKLKNPENHAKNRTDTNYFYLVSVDVGRIHDQTVCCVFRVNINNLGCYRAALVNIYVFGRDSFNKTFERQAIEIKKVIKAFNPKEVVLDTNGLGIGLAEWMTKEQYDEFGEFYPAYGFHNDEEFRKTQPNSAPQILYSLKATGALKSKIHGNVYSRISGGNVRFLIKEQEAKSYLLSTKTGQKMSPEDRVKRLMPHEMTTKLFEEMANLRLKRTGSSLDIVLEPINTRYPDDKYSSFAYGLWRIKELEEAETTKRKRRSTFGEGRQLVFFSGGR